jgi:hypothetical protein
MKAFPADIKNYVLSHWFGSETIAPNLIAYGDNDARSNTKLIITNYSSTTQVLQPSNFRNLPLMFGVPNISRDSQRRLVLNTDILAPAFYLLTKHEEIDNRSLRDEHGRFPGTESLPARIGFIDQPVVEQYRDLLVSLLKKEGVRLSSQPKQFQLVLTHDVDDPFRYLYLGRTLGVAALQAMGKRKGSPTQAIKSYLGVSTDPFDTFDWMNQKFTEAKQQLGNRVRQIFFVMACDNGPNDNGYTVENKRVRKLLKRLKKSGAEFGLHPSYKAGTHPEEIAKEKKRLEDVLEMPITQTRHHYLRLREPEHTRYLIDAGFTDDYSAGYADVAGFRNGTCQPFKYFDLERNQSTDFRIHPLPIMECTFESKSYMGLGLEDAIQSAQSIAQQSINHQGELVLLWHNPTFSPGSADYHKPFYENLLNYIYQQDSLSS